MRIAIDARYISDSYSSIAKYSENLLTHLAQVDTQNQYFVFIHRSFNRRLRVGENFTILKSPTRPLSLRTMLFFGRQVRKTRCDFLHSLSPLGPLSGADRFLLTIHDLQPITVHGEVEAARPVHTRLTSLFSRVTFPWFVQKATWLLSVSHATKDSLVGLFPEVEHKTLVVPSGVAPTFLHPPEATIAQTVARNLDLPQRFALYIGTAQPNKNVPTMIRAFARCRDLLGEKVANLHFLLVIGLERRHSDIERLCRSLGVQDRVRLMRQVTEEEKQVLYSRARLLFSVTRGEGFGFPIVEAQAMGLPVLAARDASLPEVTGDSALLVPPDDLEGIARAIGRLATDDALHHNLSEAGRENVKRFSWRRTAEAVRDIYTLLM